MCNTLLVLACVAYAGHGRRLQTPIDDASHSPGEGLACGERSLDTLEEFARCLQKFGRSNAKAAFHPSSAGVNFATGNPSLAASEVAARPRLLPHQSPVMFKPGEGPKQEDAEHDKDGEGGEQRRVTGSFPQRQTPLLDSLNDEGPQPLRSMDVPQLEQLAEEVRWQVLDAVSYTGGHLGSALGVVELTVALHHVFDTPRDELVWDVAHQVYPHKVLTGRRGRIYTLRKGGGLSGFTKRKESEYDAFGAGHSGTSISAALGFQVARDTEGKAGHAVAIIGDGAITGGMAWEAINHAGGLASKMIVILNDNGQVSLPTFYNKVNQPVGALSDTLASSSNALRLQGDIARIESSEGFQNMRNMAKQASKSLLPKQLSSAAAKVDEYARDFVKTAPFSGSGSEGQGELFEQLGFYYIGVIDGHDMNTLVSVLSNIKKDHETGSIQKPILLHIKTRKGKGYEPAEKARDKLHAVKPKFNLKKPAPAPGAKKGPPKPLPLTTVFGKSLVREGLRDSKIVAITAAMPGGTGVSIFEERFGPSRTFDVGIAEQHAVTFAGALAAGGLKPFACIYSTFMQRGYDQVIHDVALQNLPVRMILDRAGLVGADGSTHAGSFDLSYLACVPNLKICAPADEAELSNMVHTIAMIDDAPTVLRYPRGTGYGDVEMPEKPEFLTPGKGRIVRQGEGSLAILSVGTRLRESLSAAERLEGFGISATVADARWVKPVDEDLIKELAAKHRVLITIEENSIGGFAAMVTDVLLEEGCLDGIGEAPLVYRSMFLPDRYIDADEPVKQYEEAELNAENIMTQAIAALQRARVKVLSPSKMLEMLEQVEEGSV
mmetsp:Transcript_12431/g.23434  ORF Transcript_12431/g.23434 Transcript_12431/m.23434 type:complete len:833 (+) Transcript_12431:38-2536(+)